MQSKYFIINTVSVTQDQEDASTGTAATNRKSIDESQTILEALEADLTNESDPFYGETSCTCDEMLNTTKSSDWIEEES